MPFWRTFYHLIWSTRDREPLITEATERLLCALLVKKAAELGIYVHAVNTWCDHVHMVMAIPPRLAVAHVVGQLKGRSTHGLNRMAEGGFTWQRGYGVLGSPSRWSVPTWAGVSYWPGVGRGPRGDGRRYGAPIRSETAWCSRALDGILWMA